MLAGTTVTAFGGATRAAATGAAADGKDVDASPAIGVAGPAPTPGVGLLKVKEGVDDIRTLLAATWTGTPCGAGTTDIRTDPEALAPGGGGVRAPAGIADIRTDPLATSLTITGAGGAKNGFSTP